MCTARFCHQADGGTVLQAQSTGNSACLKCISHTNPSCEVSAAVRLDDGVAFQTRQTHFWSALCCMTTQMEPQMYCSPERHLRQPEPRSSRSGRRSVRLPRSSRSASPPRTEYNVTRKVAVESPASPAGIRPPASPAGIRLSNSISCPATPPRQGDAAAAQLPDAPGTPPPRSPRSSAQCRSPPRPSPESCRTPQQRQPPPLLQLHADEEQCPICMEDVDSAPTPPRNSMKPPQLPFRTSCCKQLFHRACLAQYRECAPDLAGCPLCRSKVETGLTPLEARSSRFRARTMAAVGGREAMIERHARARQAVLARVAAEEERRRLEMEAAFQPLFDTDF